ncbi:aldehyde dehydrogenase [Marixanthomonas sp. SCSIO 43207]|uniref:aldehyde dehydrogenase n=1 Tax=Marixanthomonas sp. SCSIO 43207 TaxID=2779360 RepID=UPI001CA9877D|nr:aldehyde dehydrogenase [Marixanthomonas sp. SCSIO 43207]UAB80354.1 aldehyde dehydrogenase [Marixanthomonas sp. SCSIO 43207]
MKQHITQQKEFFLSQTTKALDFRIKQLTILQEVLQNNENLLYEAIYKDFKKSEFDTFTSELALLYNDIKEAKHNLKKWARKKRVSTNFLNFPARSYILPEPLGTCLIIGAWNYPYQLSLAPVVPALAAGNTVILKPSELPKNTSAVMAKLINENFDPAVFKVVEGGVPETTELLKQDFDKIFFTGSTKVGKIVYKAAAENLTPVTLEMGGKSPAFITEDCNLSISVKRLVWAKFLNAGQTCIAPDYILVAKSMEANLLKTLKEEIEKEHFDFKNDNYVQIINDANFDRLHKMIQPEKVFYGGNVNKKDRYIQPTVLQNVSFSDPAMEEEIFGPILPVIPYTDLDKAISDVKKLPKPLSCYVFTSNKKVKQKILHNISFGGGAVNDAVMHISNPNLPFGGVGQSGIGNYHGKAGFDCFTHYKSILDKPTWLELPLKYYPHTPKRLKWIKRFLRF